MRMMLVLFVVISNCEAEEYVVRDSESSWLLPLPQAEWLNEWASTHRFKIGDSLLWKYDEGSESVLQVNKEHYHNCNKSNPTQDHKNGRAKIELNRPGSFYFISGTRDHCEQGLKLHVRVLSGNHAIGDCPHCISPPPQDPFCATCHHAPPRFKCESCHVPPKEDFNPPNDSKEKGSKDKGSKQKTFPPYQNHHLRDLNL
ncbi:early nodulin-like protein 3 [Neltuma alba]|uniref:early nodulin-like protein 3 n=1 Tax=Neltuma alba TaxID=207710 RepID=UPI0010A2F471|nr:early nodulin-like protein 3 [Prosopis alba]XP_028794988.1 early nodulin-like protein 3 [Prosopis alba]